MYLRDHILSVCIVCLVVVGKDLEGFALLATWTSYFEPANFETPKLNIVAHNSSLGCRTKDTCFDLVRGCVLGPLKENDLTISPFHHCSRTCQSSCQHIEAKKVLPKKQPRPFGGWTCFHHSGHNEPESPREKDHARTTWPQQDRTSEHKIETQIFLI